jgi:hypothetical protein
MSTQINYQIWNHCGTCTKRALQKTKGRFGKLVFYSPKADFVKRMAIKFQMSDAQMEKELIKIHLHFREKAKQI